MTPTILITGASTGIGKATAAHFAERGWNVIATMRTPEQGAELGQRDAVLVTRLDVTDLDSIDAAVAAGLARFGSIDALVNNAGYGAYGPLEATPREKIIRQFDTNVIGLLDVTRAVLPRMRAQGSGVIVNISSIGGRMAFPLGTLYHGTKWAVEGLSEAMSFELGAIGIRVKIVEPGTIDSDFYRRSLDVSNDESLTEYQDTVAKFMAYAGTGSSSPPSVVAEVIYTAVTDDTDTLRYPAGDDAHQIISARESDGDRAFIAGMKAQFGL